MPAPHDRDEGLWGRVLLAILGLGLVGPGLLAAVMMTLEEDAGPDDGLYGLAYSLVRGCPGKARMREVACPHHLATPSVPQYSRMGTTAGLQQALRQSARSRDGHTSSERP